MPSRPCPRPRHRAFAPSPAPSYPRPLALVPSLALDSRVKETQEIVALKIIDITAIDDELSEIQREMAFQASCDSPYITKYKGSYLRGTDLWILMEYMGGGSARDLVRDFSHTAHTFWDPAANTYLALGPATHFRSRRRWPT